MFILSIDVALKSLAICGITYNKKESSFDIDDKDTYRYVKVLYNWTVNLAEGKRVKDLDDITIVKLIAAFINDNIIPVLKTQLDKEEEIIILIEKQISGTPTYISYITLLALLHNFNVITMSPAYKNKLTIGGHTIADGYKKSINSYQANKEHSRLMFLHLKQYVSGAVIYNRKMEKDISDAYTQMFYYLSTNI